jgi:hypothetical protein
MANRRWFKPKRFGYGATPSTWQGWALIVAFAGVIALNASAISAFGDAMGVIAWAAWTVFVLSLTAALVVISRQKTDGEWRWRGGRRGLMN